jgi:hypothetical protein
MGYLAQIGANEEHSAMAKTDVSTFKVTVTPLNTAISPIELIVFA